MGNRWASESTIDDATACPDRTVDEQLFIGPLKAEGEGTWEFEKRTEIFYCAEDKKGNIINLSIKDDYVDSAGDLNEYGGEEIPLSSFEAGRVCVLPTLEKRYFKRDDKVYWDAMHSRITGGALENAAFEQYRGRKSRARKWRRAFKTPQKKCTPVEICWLNKYKKASWNHFPAGESGRIVYDCAPLHFHRDRLVPVRKPRPRPKPPACPMVFLPNRKSDIPTRSLNVFMHVI